MKNPVRVHRKGGNKRSVPQVRTPRVVDSALASFLGPIRAECITPQGLLDQADWLRNVASQLTEDFMPRAFRSSVILQCLWYSMPSAQRLDAAKMIKCLANTLEYQHEAFGADSIFIGCNPLGQGGDR